MGTFLEGVSVIVQACTLVIGLPALALTLAARHRAPVVAGVTVVATAAMMWSRTSGHWQIASSGWVVFPIAIVIAAAFYAVGRRATPTLGIAAGAGLCGGAIAGWIWQPCVGAHLGDILNTTSEHPARTLLLLIVYTTGALLPAVLVAALPVAWPTTAAYLRSTSVQRVAVVLGAIYAATVASGQYNDLVGELSRWSSA